MPVSSYVVTATSGQLAEAIESVSKIEGMLVGASEEESFPAAFTSDTEKEAQDLGRQIEVAQGVSKALLVYHNFEDIEEYQTQ